MNERPKFPELPPRVHTMRSAPTAASEMPRSLPCRRQEDGSQGACTILSSVCFVGYTHTMAANREGRTWGDVVYYPSGHQQQLNQGRTVETALGEGPPSYRAVSRLAGCLAPVPQHSSRPANASGSGRGRTRMHSTQPADYAATGSLAAARSLPRPSAVLAFPRRLAACPMRDPPAVPWWARACLRCSAPRSHR